MTAIGRRSLFALPLVAPLAVVEAVTRREQSPMAALEQFVDKRSARRLMLGDLLDGKAAA